VRAWPVEPGGEALGGLGWHRVGAVLPPYPAFGSVGWVVNAGHRSASPLTPPTSSPRFVVTGAPVMPGVA